MDEVGLTSAPLQTIAFHLGAYCKDYNEDFMKCKDENGDPKACLLEGRKVTRCALDLIKKVKANCFEQFTSHYECLDKNNQLYQKCRGQEQEYNGCVFSKLGITKTVPGNFEGETPIHLKKNAIYK